MISDNVGTSNVGAMYTKNATVDTSSTKIINNSTPGMIGAIYNNANAGTSSLTMNDCTISNNRSKSVGGIDNVALGGGDFMLTLNRCTISDNEAGVDGSADGGGLRAYVVGDTVANTGELNLTNCTFSGNTARNKGGAIALLDDNADSNLSVNLINCTIVGNTADSNDVCWHSC
ncbi:MAG: hypothetical protein DRH24_09730 [Deltaproteobacteria bacterium]|nr:MAG: hypothetical protein DRH24_09730 [Deltaproteobacteria bacterium]